MSEARTYQLNLDTRGAKLTPEYLRDVAKKPDGLLLIMEPHLSTIADALEIADESAVSLIESESRPVDLDNVRWWETRFVQSDASEGVAQALRYLEARRLLIRAAEDSTFVRFRRPGE